MNVLLIEDNPGDARLIELMLREAGGMQLQWVDRLREGLEVLGTNAMDLVLLDLGLPDSHGLETLGAVRKANHETPVVVLTGNNDEEMALDALKAGAQDYLVKGNVNADALKRVIRYAIERKRAEQAILDSERKRRHLHEQLLHAQRLDSIGHLAGGVAHDFNNVLSVVIGYSDVVLGKLPPDSPLKPKVESIISAGQRGAALARQLLIFGRKQVAEPKALDLGRTLAEFEKMLRRLIGEEVKLVGEVEDDLWSISADPTLMEQVIMNLAINARDAMPDGGSLTVRIRNATVASERILIDTTIPPGRYVELSVTDSGCGIPDRVRVHLYEPFFTTKAVGKGTGLGLSVVYGIVKQAEGHISCETEVGKGTTFHIWFPRIHSEADKTATVTSAAFPKGHETVLVVEDQPDLLTMVTDALKEWGYRCLKAHDAEEALSLAREEQIQLLLTDLVLPAKGGKRLAAEIRALRPDLRVIYMSGYPSSAEADETEGAAGDGEVVLQKPFQLPLLAQTVRAVLDRSVRKAKSQEASGARK